MNIITRSRKVAACLALLFVLTAPAWADRTEVSPGQYLVGIPTGMFVHFAAPEGTGRQRMQNWCWAACIQMVLNWHGLHVSQEDLVKRVFGGEVDRPAQPDEMLRALRGSVPDASGGESEITAEVVNLESKTDLIVHDLEFRWPLVVGLNGKNGTGHAYVLTAAYYYLDQTTNKPVISRVVLRDPYPTKPSRVEMLAPEFHQRCSFMTRVHVNRHPKT